MGDGYQGLKQRNLPTESENLGGAVERQSGSAGAPSIKMIGGAIMKARTTLVMLAVLPIAALLTAGAGLTVANNAGGEAWAPCNPAGAYFWTVPDWNTSGVEIVIPNDSTCTSTTHITKYYHLDPTLGGMFPEATGYSDAVGMGRRTGVNTWDVTVMRYGSNGAKKVYIVVMSGEEAYTDDGSVQEATFTAAIFLAEQDKDGDGWPDDDEAPQMCLPLALTSSRMPVLPMCEVMPTAGSGQ
jgi:hypothetical protein